MSEATTKALTDAIYDRLVDSQVLPEHSEDRIYAVANLAAGTIEAAGTTKAIIRALESDGYRIVKQVEAGRAYAVILDAEDPEDVKEGWQLEGLDEKPLWGPDEVTYVPVWVDQP